MTPQAWLALIAAVILLILIIPPALSLVNTSLHTTVGLRNEPVSLGNYRALVTGDLGHLLRNTLVYSFGTTAIVMVVGSGLAWLVERTNTPLGSLVYVAAFTVLAVPGIVSVVGWILLLGPNAGLLNRALSAVGLGRLNLFSMPGMIFVEVLTWTPVVFLLMVTPFKFMDPSLEEAGFMAGASRWKVFWRVTAPLAWPSALAALMLTLIRTLESFESPALIGLPGGVRVLTTQIYQEVNSGFIAQYGGASAYGVVLVGLVIVLLWQYNRQTANTARFATITGKGFRPNRLLLGRWRPVGAVVCVSVLAVVLLPLLILSWASFLPYYNGVSVAALHRVTWGNYAHVFSDSSVARAATNTLLAAGVSGVGVMVLALVTAWVSIRSDVGGRRLLDHLASIPLVIPGVVAGLAVLEVYLRLPVPIYGTIWLLVIAYAMRYVPYGMRYASAGILQIHRDLEESAEVSGAPVLRRLRRVVVPLAVPSLVGGFIFTFLNGSSQLAMPLMLAGPKTTVISVLIYNLYQDGALPQLAAFSICVTVVAIVLAFLAHRISRTYGI